ncbi:MAG: S49 family peptidase, partial [Pseudomonadota bacterium]
MKKFLTGLVAGILLAILTGVIVFFATLRLGERRPTVTDGSTLVLALDGDIPEQAPVELPLPIPFLEQHTPVTVEETWLTLRQAAGDPRIKAAVLLPSGLDAGWAKLEEIHDDLAAFKKSGKPLYAFLRNPGAREYYLASVADRIFMTPTDMLDVKGLRVEMMFVEETLKKIGVEMEVEHVGKFKDAGDMFTRTSMTPETREVMNAILDQYYGDLVQTIAAGRKKSPAAVRALIDNGPFPGREALAGGLVDSLGFEDRMYDELQQRLHEDKIRKISNRDYRKAADASHGGESARRIALVVGQGAILRGPAQEMQDDAITSGGMIKLLRQVEDDPGIRGVILRIDSPGGDGVASDDILHEVEQ